MRVYRHHRCDRRHRTYLAWCRCAYPHAHVAGDGAHASRSRCGHPHTIHLHGTPQEAEQQREWIDRNACGGRCIREHDTFTIYLGSE